jgi:tetratricopeptide (TPR) repeat protein
MIISVNKPRAIRMNNQNIILSPEQYPAPELPPESRSKRTKLIVIVLMILIFSMCFVVYMLVRNNNSSPQPAEKITGNELIAKVNSLNATGKYDEARELASADNSLDGQLLLGNTLYAEKKYEEALVQYKKAEQDFGLDQVVAHSIAQAAESAGKFEEAMKYYQKVLEFIEKDENNPTQKADIRYYSKLIDGLKEKL